MAMDPSRFVELQHQMKQNQAEVHDFLKDMDSWESDIKVKDESLKEAKPAETQKLPPIRNSLEKKRRKKRTKKSGDEEKKKETKKKINGYDYRAWDKFDVDKACESDSGSDSSEYETDEEWEDLRRKQQAENWKEQGNQYLKESKLNEAIECYTRGIDCDPANSILPANRAMALMKQDKHAAAELDCTASLTIDPTYVKAYLRRGTCRIAVKKFEEAKLDFLEVLKLEPTNKQANKELENIEKLLHPPMLLKNKDSDIGIVMPVHKSAEQRSRKPLRRIQVEEIGIEGESIRAAAVAELKAGQSDATKQLEEKDNEMFEQFIKPSDIGTTKSKEPSKPRQEEESYPVTKPIENGVPKLDLKEVTKPIASKKKTSADSTPNSSPRLPDVPTSSFQFQTSWKVVKDNPDMFYEYFKQIDPKSYQKLFGESLDSDVLNTVYKSLKMFYIRDSINVFPVLKQLVNVKRFDMINMFMSSKEKTVVQDLFKHMRAANETSCSDIDALAKKYGV